jgi:hypothetical protein
VTSKVTCIFVKWSIPAPGHPDLYCDEIDETRWSLRCIRGFPDGTRHAFHATSYRWRDQMPEAPIPDVAQINVDAQFKAKHISKKAFQQIWDEVYGLNQHSMLEPILDVVPEFRPHWDSFVLEWADSPHLKGPEDLPLYLVIATLAKCLVTLLEVRQIHAFPAVFATVERWLSHGDKYVYDGAGAGLLEDLQNPVHYQNSVPDDFKPWLGVQTLVSWERLKIS